jgi:hypothetical protein
MRYLGPIITWNTTDYEYHFFKLLATAVCISKPDFVSVLRYFQILINKSIYKIKKHIRTYISYLFLENKFK